MFETWNGLGSVPALLGPPLYAPQGGGVDQTEGPYHPLDYPVVPVPINCAPIGMTGTPNTNDWRVVYPAGCPQNQPAITTNPTSTLPPGRTPQDLTACLAYIKKYRAVFGRDPVNIWCAGMQETPVDVKPAPRPYQPPIHVPPTPPPQPPMTTSPHVWARKHWHPRRRPPVKRPTPPAVSASPTSGELCPARGWVARAIPGVDEYRTVACTPGRPVVIDQGLATVVRQEAFARHGLSDLDGFTVGNITIPTWALAVGAGVVAFMFLGKTHRR